MSENSKHNQKYLQERLRDLSLKTNCPTKQENGQRYLGPPIDWSGNPPTNAEVFISKLPFDCFEDEIYNFCSQFGKIYLIRLMINFENENRGFCFVTFSSSKEANTAVTLLPKQPLRKGYYIHAEISLNNCTLKIYGLDFKWNDEKLEKEIRSNAKDVANVTIKRNMTQKTLMATLYFDTHQKAAIARRKLSQIANSRWGQNVKVFLWSKKLQNKNLIKQDEDNVVDDKFSNKIPMFVTSLDCELNEDCQNRNDKQRKEHMTGKNVEFQKTYDLGSWLRNNYECFNDRDCIQTKNTLYKPKLQTDINNNVHVPKNIQSEYQCTKSTNKYEIFPQSTNANTGFQDTMFSNKSSSYYQYSNKGTKNYFNAELFPFSNESSPNKNSTSSSSTGDIYDDGVFAIKSEINYSLDDADNSIDYFKYSNHTKRAPFDWYQDNKIELILKEALNALVKNNLNE